MLSLLRAALLAALARDASALHAVGRSSLGHAQAGPQNSSEPLNGSDPRGGELALREAHDQQRNSSASAPPRRECAKLKNVEGTHYIVKVEVGNPPQEFDLIPDTGSPWIIIPDSECRSCECGRVNKCFQQRRSRTLEIPRDKFGDAEEHHLMFGSGPIQVSVASDTVRIGGSNIGVDMKKGVLLMKSHELTFSGSFEGIVGLGMPEHMTDPSAHLPGVHSYTDGFLEKAGVYNYSVCFGDDGWGGNSGVLSFGSLDPQAKQLQITHDTMHWQVPFFGMTIGGHRASFCQQPDHNGLVSPCAAIFDSGTTYILGPTNQIMSLYETLCTQWPRCRQKFNEYTAEARSAQEAIRAVAGGGDKPQPTYFDRSMVFQLLLNDCQDWLDKEKGVSEIPGLVLHVSSRNGVKHTLKLDPWDFIVAQEQNVSKVTYSDFRGVRFASGYRRTAATRLSCTAAFATMEFPTKSNGPAWIIGMPIFFSYMVSYNIGTKPPSVSFDTSPCGTCNSEGDDKRLWNRPVGPRTPSSKRNQPRRMEGEPHLPARARQIVL